MKYHQTKQLVAAQEEIGALTNILTASATLLRRRSKDVQRLIGIAVATATPNEGCDGDKTAGANSGAAAGMNAPPAPRADHGERADTSPGAAARTAARPSPHRRGEGAPKMGNQLRPDIVDALRLLPEPLQPEAVAKVSGLTPKNARQWLDRATHRGWLTKAGRGLWQRAPAYPPHVLTSEELLQQMRPKS